MSLTKYIVCISFLSLISLSSAFAGVGGSTEVACSTYGADALSCNQCFDAGTDYVGDATAKAFDDTFLNYASYDQLIYRETGMSTVLTPLQSSVTVGTSRDYGVAFAPSLLWLQQDGKDAHIFLSGYSELMAKMTGGILFTAVTPGANPNKPALRYDYVVQTYQYDWNTYKTVGSAKEHRECAFVKPRWCGDNIVSNGEVCDDGANNGKGGYCNTACTGMNPPPTPSCDSLTATPTSGQAVLEVALTCNATNATNYKIDCGNGITNLQSTATCRYTYEGTFTPRCTVDGSYTSPACTKTVTVSAPPPAPKCSPILSGALDHAISGGTPGLCDVGSSENFTSRVVGSTTNYTWSCKNVTSTNCSASYTPAPPPVTCDSLTATPSSGTAPLNVVVGCAGTNATSYQIVCAPGRVIDARTGTCTYTTVGTYTPRCTVNGNITSPACTKSVTVNPPPVFPDLYIKKYAKYLDSRGDTQNAPIQLEPGEAFNYYYTVENSGAAPANDVIVKDTFPDYISWNGNVTIKNPSGADVTSDWTCVKDIYPGTTRVTLVCKKNTPLPARSGKYTFTIPVKLDPAAPTGTDLRNIAYVCADNDSDSTDNCDTNPPPPPPNDCDDPLPPGVPRDPACVEVGGNFDLSVQKKVKSDDVFARVNPTEDFDYTIIVTNNGTGSSTGATIVRDVLPSPVILQAGKVPSGNGWTCTRVSDRDFTCTYTGSISADNVYPTITVPARVTNLAYRPEAYVNYAYVYNPYEKIGKRCRTDGGMPDPTLGGTNGQTPQNVCNEDVRNFDPATISTANPNGFDLELHKYVNDDDEASRPNANGSIIYTFVVRNLGALASSGRTYVRDTDFPLGITLSAVEASQNGWTCRNIDNTVGNTANKNGFECYRDDVLAVDDEYPKITVYATAEASLIPGVIYRNVACLSNPNDPHDSLPGPFPDLGQYKVNNCNPAEIVVVPPGTFDLTIVKRVGNNLTDGSLKDRNTANEGDGEQDILIIGRNAPLVYTFDVKNLGPVAATGTTTVEDTLPEGISATGVSGAGWTCSITGNGNRSWICTRPNENLPVGSSFPRITLDATSSTAALVGVYSNVATVSNPGDTNPTNNTDPANVKIVVNPTCGSLTANPNISPNNPNTPITYTCAAVGYSGPATNLEYNITCGSSDLGWSGSNTRMCPLPGLLNTTQVTTCKIQDKTNSGVIFTGSMVGSCRNEIRTTGTTSENRYIGKSCVNSVPSCAVYANRDDCERNKDPRAQCYYNDYNGIQACQNGAPTSCSGGSSGYCGDGVVQYPEEECDDGGKNGGADSLCSTACKINSIDTNPGSNPPTDIWMTIPTLSNARLGYSWLDGEPGKVLFHENNMILGEGTKAFTLADTVGFGIKTEYQKAFIIESDKLLCLSSTGSSLNQNELCTAFGEHAADGNIFVETICGKEYIVMGFGDYQIPVNCTPPLVYTGRTANYDNTITLFKGSQLYDTYSISGRGGRVTLNSGFQGATRDTNGSLILSNGSLSYAPSTSIPLVALDVKVSGALVGGTAGTVNRKIDTYIDAGNLVNLFLSGIKSNTTTTANTSTESNNAVAEVNMNANISGNQTGSSVTGSNPLERFAVNGNKNILSVKDGDLTIESCPNDTLTLDGVRTVIVENGDLIIKCNIVYASNDTTSSWAFIVKGGDIQVYPGTTNPGQFGVTNIAGVYVAIPEFSVGGAFRSIGNQASQKILKIDGSMYGNAEPLFNSRLYVRGTNAYEILTTGVVLSYSNRALVSPPPLLSSYLNNYSVTRVVK